jgi:hypothetical protein
MMVQEIDNSMNHQNVSILLDNEIDELKEQYERRSNRHETNKYSMDLVLIWHSCELLDIAR